MNEVIIQGNSIKLKERGCICTQITDIMNDPYVSISVYITNDCNGLCKFCCNVDNLRFVFNYPLFCEFIDEVYSKIRIRKITFTGGEPSLKAQLLSECVDYVRGKCENITVCTNGTLINEYGHEVDQYTQRVMNWVTNISVSYHHWNHETNNEILGINLSSNNFAKLPKDVLQKINLSCNLMKGFVDDQEKMCRLLDHAYTLGVKQVAFVRLMPVNGYCKDHVVKDLTVQPDGDVLHYRKWTYTVDNVCECNNYLYRTKDNNFVEFYIRNNMCPSYNQGSFIVYKHNRVQPWYN